MLAGWHAGAGEGRRGVDSGVLPCALRACCLVAAQRSGQLGSTALTLAGLSPTHGLHPQRRPRKPRPTVFGLPTQALVVACVIAGMAAAAAFRLYMLSRLRDATTQLRGGSLMAHLPDAERRALLARAAHARVGSSAGGGSAGGGGGGGAGAAASSAQQRAYGAAAAKALGLDARQKQQ